jgi:di/tripeptidase
VCLQSGRPPQAPRTICLIARTTHSKQGALQLLVSSRSSINSSLHALRDRIRIIGERCGASVDENDVYPCWCPNPESGLVQLVRSIYVSKFELEPKLTAIHAGLEVSSLKSTCPVASLSCAISCPDT